MQGEEGNRPEIGERIGPLRVQAPIADAHQAECYVAGTPDHRVANVWRWPASKLSGVVVPSLALLIDNLHDVNVAGASPIVHGSVATEHAVIAFVKPRGRPLAEYLRRGKTSPIEAVTSTLSLLDTLSALRALGVRAAWWTPQSLWAADDEAQWTLAAPGLNSALSEGNPQTVDDIAFRAPEAVDAGALAEADEDAYGAIELYAVGATLFYALSQRLPYDRDTIASYVEAQRGDPAVRLDELFDHLEPYQLLVDAVASCLSREPQDRPASLDALRRTLEDAEREVRYQHSRVDFLPARVSETTEMRRPGRRGDREARDDGENRSNALPLVALVALIAIALFLIAR